jgi:hypothetical protein
MALKVNWASIVKLLQEGEGPTVEFVPQVKKSKDITQIIIGFANAQGGTVVLGLDDKNGHLNGVDVTPEWITAVCKTECEPAVSPQVGELIRNDKHILVLQVKEGLNKPYRTVDGSVVLTREGSQTREASVEEQKELNPWGVGGINPRQKKALNFISEQGSISNKQYRELCDVSHKTAHIELTELVEKGVLKVEGQGRSTAYVLMQKAKVSSAISSSGPESTVLSGTGQLFAFEDTNEVSADSARSVPEPKPVRPRTYVKKTAPKASVEPAKKTVNRVKSAETPIKHLEEETYEPPIGTKEESDEGSEDSSAQDPLVIAGEDYADTRPNAKAPEVDEEDTKDAASPSFLDL